MLLSTSSSEPTPEAEEFVRASPDKPWMRMLAVVVVIVMAAGAGFEAYARASGFGPTYNDTPNLWAEVRTKAVGVGPEQIIFVGASRTLFDMDLEVIRKETGGPLPIQLATVGSNPTGIFADLAADPTVAGTVIFGVVPGLVAAGGGPPVAWPKKFINHYKNWSWANRWELPMVLFLQDHLAFIKQSDLSLSELLADRVDLPLRDNVYAPKIPDYMYTLNRVRQAHMADSIAHDPEAMRKVQQTWIPLMGGPPKPDVFTQEQWDKMMFDGWEANLASIKTGVQTIQARGGRVIFHRLPSTETVLEIEDKKYPRKDYWDRILKETGAPGIYFSDEPELSGFKCPEWSHLNKEDAAEYSRRFVRVLRAKGLL